MPVDLGHERMADVEIARLAGAKIGAALVIGDFGRAAARIDRVAQGGAPIGIEEVAGDEQVERAIGHALDARGGNQPPRDVTVVSHSAQRAPR